MVAGFCAWYIWTRRDKLLQPGEGFGLAAIPLAFLSLLWLVGVVLSVRLVHQAAVPPLILGWILAVAGWPATMAALPVVAVFFLIVPFWGVLGPILQSITVLANAVILGVANVDATIEGTYITISSGVFEVAEGCSGVKYLESGVIVAAIYGVMFLRTWRARAVAVGLAALLSMISNWLRVAGLIIVGDYTQMQSPLIEDHNTYGWIIFAATIAIFFVLVRRIENYDDRIAEPLEATAAWVSAATSGFAPQLRAAALPTLAALTGPLLLLGSSLREVQIVAPQSLSSITPSAEWVRVGAVEVTPAPVAVETDSSVVPTEYMPAFSGAGEHRRERWRADSVVVQVDRLIYFTQEQDRELINALNRVAVDDLGSGLVGPLDDRGRMIMATIARVGEQPHLVWSWFSVAGVNTHSKTEAKMLELVAFASPREAAELVTVSTPCSSTNCAAASQRLFRFVTGSEAPVNAPSEGVSR